MKKKLTTCLAIAAVLTVLMVLSASQVFAGEYKYRITIYSGQQGHFDSGKSWSKEYSLGELAEIDLKDLGFQLDNEKYYVRGLRLTGHDNDETSGSQNMTFEVDQDLAYEVAYGIKGQMVEYKVTYVDANGKELHDPDIYYGMPGDKPVVAFRYVEGYVPDVYTQSKTITKDGDNNFFFTYRTAPTDERTVTQTETVTDPVIRVVRGPAAPGTAANPAGTTTAGAPGAAGAAAGAGGGAATGNAPAPATDATIGDNNTPLVEPGQYNDNDNIEGNQTPTSENAGKGIPTLLIAGGGIVIVLLALALWYFSKKKKEENV